MLLQVQIDRRDIVAKILCWVVIAVRPLTLPELSAVLESHIKPAVHFNLDQVVRDQVSCCGYILTLTAEEERVNLIHQSAKDYLLRGPLKLNPELEVFHIKEAAANLEIAKKCFQYLQSGALANGEVDLETDTAHLKAFPLLSYAVLHWPEHAKSLARSEEIFDLSLPFYQKHSRLRRSWLKTYSWWRKNWFRTVPFELLHVASYFGILPLAETLLLRKDFLHKIKRLRYVK